MSAVVVPQSLSVSESSAENPLCGWIVRFRWIFFALIAVMLVAGFNGRWRVGRDSARYREVASNIAEGQGYTFRGQRERHVNPGLPYLLAGIDKAFGRQDALRPKAALAVMALLGALTLIVIYHLVQTRYPRWIAVCVTTGTGINILFLQYAHELMTDLPFILGACLVLLGLAKVTSGGRMSFALGAVLIVAGAALAISMRPTFWALVLACGGACMINLVRSRYRLWCIGGIIAVAAVLAVWWAIDPRLSAQGSLLAGRYERTVMAHLQSIGDRNWLAMLWLTLNRHIPQAFFGFDTIGLPRWIEPLRYLGLMLSLMLIGGAFLLMRRSLIWGLYVLVTMGMTLVLGSVPRYYLMILPLVLIEHALISKWVADRFARWKPAAVLVLLYGLGLATLVNLGQSVDFIMEQHGMKRSLKVRPFLEVYRGGKMAPIVRLGEQIARTVPKGEKVLGIEPHITTFISGRIVYDSVDVLQDHDDVPWGKLMENRRFCATLAKNSYFVHALAQHRKISDLQAKLSMRKPSFWQELGREYQDRSTRDRSFWRAFVRKEGLWLVERDPDFWAALLRYRKVRFYTRRDVKDPDYEHDKRTMILINRGCIALDPASEIKVDTMYLGRLGKYDPPLAWR